MSKVKRHVHEEQLIHLNDGSPFERDCPECVAREERIERERDEAERLRGENERRSEECERAREIVNRAHRRAEQAEAALDAADALADAALRSIDIVDVIAAADAYRAAREQAELDSKRDRS